jgi:RHS repeat-associated protein
LLPNTNKELSLTFTQGEHQMGGDLAPRPPFDLIRILEERKVARLNNPKNKVCITGKERDAETGLDFFGARYFSGAQGRFTSPDPAGNAVADPSNPQSWNQYAYVMNNPLIFTDPTGQECVWDDGSYDSADDPDTGSYGQCSSLGGTWIDSDVFASSGYYAGDWSPDLNLSRAALVSDIQACSASVGGGQAASLLIADAFASGFSDDMTAYLLGTANQESAMGMRMSESARSKNIPYYVGILGNKNLADAKAYSGRGYIQITGKSNYGYWSNELGVDLVNHPEMAAMPDIAAQIGVEGMDKGSFRPPNSLYDYVNPSGTDFFHARNVVNSRMNAAGTIAANAVTYSLMMTGCR